MNNFVVIEASVFLDSRLTSTDILVYAMIYGLSRNDNKECYASNDYLGSKRHLSARQVQRSIKKLKELNYIIVYFKKNKRIIKTFINSQITQRDEMNDFENNKIQLFDYDWLNED